MKQIYDFEQHTPPVLNEQMLRAVLLGYSAIDWYPVLSVLCFGYIVIAATGGGVIAIVYSRQRGITA